MLTVQGLAAYLAGALAQLLTPGRAMAVMAAASLLATAALVAPLRRRRAHLVVAGALARPQRRRSASVPRHLQHDTAHE
jgi:hypothetical protein